eukprot:scaffold12825_cov68-Skeletonema_dohrnii-CCMP3373.AAC.5
MAMVSCSNKCNDISHQDALTGMTVGKAEIEGGADGCHVDVVVGAKAKQNQCRIIKRRKAH